MAHILLTFSGSIVLIFCFTLAEKILKKEFFHETLEPSRNALPDALYGVAFLLTTLRKSGVRHQSTA
jgi:hypothetical protein